MDRRNETDYSYCCQINTHTYLYMCAVSVIMLFKTEDFDIFYQCTEADDCQNLVYLLVSSLFVKLH